MNDNAVQCGVLYSEQENDVQCTLRHVWDTLDDVVCDDNAVAQLLEQPVDVTNAPPSMVDS